MTDLSTSFFCPITRAVMEDPVVDPEGNSYERHAIEEWIRQSGRSPITRTILSIDDLRPNRALKDTIDQHRHSIPSDIRLEPLPIIVNTSEVTAVGNYANGFIHVSIQPSSNEIRSPCDICCVVDTSGSMKEHAEIQNDKNERYGLSQLELVKHALKTIVHSLEIQDRLSIVSFSDSAKIVCQLIRMDEKGRKDALTAIDKLSVSASDDETHLYDHILCIRPSTVLILSRVMVKQTYGMVFKQVSIFSHKNKIMLETSQPYFFSLMGVPMLNPQVVIYKLWKI